MYLRIAGLLSQLCPQIAEKYMVRKSQFRKMPHFRKIHKSSKSFSSQICDLQNLLADRPSLPLIIICWFGYGHLLMAGSGPSCTGFATGVVLDLQPYGHAILVA
jgi:hypothetical protein